MEQNLLNPKQYRVGPVQCAKTTPERRRAGMTWGPITLAELLSCNCFLAAFLKDTQDVSGLTQVETGTWFEVGRIPQTLVPLGCDRCVIDESQRDAIGSRAQFKLVPPAIGKRATLQASRHPYSIAPAIDTSQGTTWRTISPWQRPQAWSANGDSPGLMNRNEASADFDPCHIGTRRVSRELRFQNLGCRGRM